MPKHSLKTATGVALAAAFVFNPAWAQENQTTDLTGQDITVDKLVGALKIPTRGIEAKCSPYQEQMERLTRGIGVATNAIISADEVPAIAAVKTASVTATFELNSAQLTPQSKELLSTMAEALNSQDLAPQCFQLAGHTCDLGVDAYNMDLSRRRAQSVKDYLVANGVAAERLVTTGFGETSPLVSNESPEAREKNRRVDVGALAPPNLEYQ
jgi:outer membrane protein OmpA-like peptidoglycan-associated protein